MKSDRQFQEFGQDVDYMPDVLAAEHMKEKKIAPVLLGTVFLTIVFLITWAYFAEIDEVAHGLGQVIPSSRLQVVNHLEGGVIKEIDVKEGEVVQKGQLLLKIDNTVAKARYLEGKTLYYRQLAEVARLKAQIASIPFKVPEEVLKHAPSEGQEVMHQYNAHVEDLQNQVMIAEQEVSQRQQELNELQSTTNELNRQLQLINSNVEQIAPLVKKKLEPEITLNNLLIDQSKLLAQISSLKANIARAEAARDQAVQKMKQVTITSKAKDFNDLQKASDDLATAQGSFTSDQYRFSLTDIRSPVHGIIKQLLVTTLGSVIKPGEDLVEIVPIGDTLLIEAKINPRDVAFLRPGLKASVKITAYDSAIYGDLKAELIRISADSTTDKEGRVYYMAYLRTKGSILSKTKKKLPIIPGMVASVDIITGKRTVLDYLLYPITRARERAFTER